MANDRLSNTCEVCFEETRNRRLTNTALAPAKPMLGLLCTRCRSYADYWNGLSPEDRAAEHRSMVTHVAETNGAA